MKINVPAGNIKKLNELVKLDINSIYVGYSEFNLRKAYPKDEVTLNLDELKKAREITLKFNKELFVAVNSLVAQNNIVKFYHSLEDSLSIEPDGIIVGDFAGIDYLSKRKFKNIHVSSIQNISSIEEIKAFKNLGVKRFVIPSYYTLNPNDESLEVINHLINNKLLETECFLPELTNTKGIRIQCKNCRLAFFENNTNAQEGECTNLKSKNLRPCIDYSKKTLGEDGLKNYRVLSYEEFINKLLKSSLTAIKVEGRQKPINQLKDEINYLLKIINK